MNVYSNRGTLEDISLNEWNGVKDLVKIPTYNQNQLYLLRSLLSRNGIVREEAREMLLSVSPILRAEMTQVINSFPEEIAKDANRAFRVFRVGLEASDFALGNKKVYGSGEFVFKEGDNGESAYVVNAGGVVIQKELNGENKTMHVYILGEVFGDYSLLFDVGRTASAFALEPTTLTEITANNYYEALRLKPVERIKDEIALARHRMKEVGMDGNIILRREISDLLS